MRTPLSLLVLLVMVMVMMAMGDSPPLMVREANGADYLALKALDKLNLLWENCIEELKSSQWFNFLQMAELFVEPMCPVFRSFHHHLPLKRPSCPINKVVANSSNIQIYLLRSTIRMRYRFI